MLFHYGDFAKEERFHMRDGEGTVHMQPIVAGQENLPEKCRLFNVITLPKGASIGYHVHEKETEMFYFLSGSGKVLDDEKKLPVQAGDALVTSNGHGHSVINDGEDDLVMVAVIVLDA